MKIIISPAKSISIRSQASISEVTLPVFYKETCQLVKKMQGFSIKKLKSLMDISTDIAELNVQRFADWDFSEGLTESKYPAISCFTGEVYRGLDADSLDMERMTYTQNNLRILSGLYGLIKPCDAIQPYRLEMGTRWKITPKVSSLYQFWGTKITNNLKAEMEGDEVLINLASSEYFKVLDLKTLNRRMITPVFKELKNGEYKVVMTYAKNARGKMARFIIENKLDNCEDLKAFAQDGYALAASLSSENEWVFVR